jgi:hypothetical protein
MTIASAVPSRSIRAIDSHLHVWSSGEPPFPFAEGKEPPASLRHCSSAGDLLDSMAAAGIPCCHVSFPVLTPVLVQTMALELFGVLRY